MSSEVNLEVIKMFDWVKKLLFEEEETVVEEDKLEEIDFTKVNDLENIITETPEEEVKVVEEVVKEEVKVEEVKEENENTVAYKKEFNIQLDGPTTPQVQETPIRRRVERERTERVERTERSEKESNVEVMSVISPIFGGKEVKKSTQKKVVTVAPKKKDSIGIVISPMYGQKELQEHQAEATVRIEENKSKQMPLVEDDDWKNDIPLDELISTTDETNDCVQFSLFGDDQTINE